MGDCLGVRLKLHARILMFVYLKWQLQEKIYVIEDSTDISYAVWLW